MSPRVLLAALLFIAAAVVNALADQSDIESHCTRMYPGVWQYLSWRDCVKKETEEAMLKGLMRMREERARPCIAADISRMEKLATIPRETVNAGSTLEDAKRVLDPLLSGFGSIQISKANIKQRVLVYQIATRCASDFHFLININADQAGALTRIVVWSEKPPEGYPGGAREEFSIDFEEQRRIAIYEAGRQEREKKKEAADRELQRKLRELMGPTISSVRIEAQRMLCSSRDCAMKRLEVDVKNVSERPVEGVALGYVFLDSPNAKCPEQMGTNERSFKMLQPGETATISILVFNGPQNANAKYCVAVTGVGLIGIAR